MATRKSDTQKAVELIDPQSGAKVTADEKLAETLKARGYKTATK